MIKLTNLNKYYKSGMTNYHALVDINLTLPDKGLVFITGKSGSGKSTLLNIIGGLDAYDSGELLIDNINTANFTKKDYNIYRNTYIGFIFQEFNVIKSLTVYENVALSLELHHEKIKEHHQAIMDIIAKVGLQGKEKRRMNEISGGEKQRVAIARALIKMPKVIIADEPTGNLDSINRDMVMNILKELSKERLVLIVTHDKKMANLYGDRMITIKDGHIIEDQVIKEENIVYEEKPYEVKPINPSFLTSLSLAFKAFLKNKLRFIFIIVLFAFSLIFAASVVNLYLASPAKEYAAYQQEYHNRYVDISKKYINFDNTIDAGFYTYELDQLTSKYASNQETGMQYYKSMYFNIPINPDNIYTDDLVKSSIERIIISDTIRNMNLLNESDAASSSNYGVYITDYVATNLIYFNYFEDDTITSIDQIVGKSLKFEEFNNNLFIKNIILTDYKTLQDAINSNDTKSKAAFIDNLPFYNAIFVNTTIFNLIVGTDIDGNINFKYTYDDIIFNCLNKKGLYDNIKIMPYDENMNFVQAKNEQGENLTDGEGNPIYLGSAPLAPLPQQATQMAVSKGFIEKVLGLSLDNYSFSYSANDANNIMNNEYGNFASFYIYGYRRIPTTLNFYVTGIIDTDDVVIYTPATSEYTLFSNYLTSSFSNGGFLVMEINENQDVNAKIYDDFLDNQILINNVSFRKLLIVDQFIDSNLILFLGLFFIFGLFSILLIFNFIIINIKNSTKDIGIYMSLGMNGWKISLIYLFQVIIISTIAMVISVIGTTIFLIVLDKIFSAQALVDFTIIKVRFLGIITTIVLAYITPIIAVIFPLLNLSNKKPIDIIKVS